MFFSVDWLELVKLVKIFEGSPAMVFPITQMKMLTMATPSWGQSIMSVNGKMDPKGGFFFPRTDLQQ